MTPQLWHLMPFKCGYGSRWKTLSLCSAQGFQISSNNHNFTFPGYPDVSKATQNLNLRVSHVVNLTERVCSACNPPVMLTQHCPDSTSSWYFVPYPPDIWALQVPWRNSELNAEGHPEARVPCQAEAATFETVNFQKQKSLDKHSRVCPFGLVSQFSKCCQSLDGQPDGQEEMLWSNPIS